MRSLTGPARSAISNSAGHWVFAYLEVTNFDGTWINTGALAAGSTWNAFNTCSLSDDIDKNTLSMSATMLRESGAYSLAPFRSDSPLNAANNSTYSPLLDLHRQWRLMVAVVARGTTPTVPSGYREMASGIVDRIDVQGDPAIITIQGRGREADLMDAMVANANRVYGTDALTEDLGDTLQAMLDDQMGTGVVPLTFDPAHPAFALSTFTQDESALLPAIADAAALAGALVRYKYDASDVHTLTLFEPNRSATVPDWSIAGDEYEALDVGLDLGPVRNYIPLRYVDSTTGNITTVISPAAQAGTVTVVAGAATFSTSQAGVLRDGAIVVVDGVAHVVSAFNGTTGATLSGAPSYSAVQWHTSASITRYGLRSMPIDLSADTRVTDGTSAQGFADKVRSDMEYPIIEQSLRGSGLWFAELGDYVKTVANGVHYDQDQYGGITSIQHTFSEGHLSTTLGMRGQPAGRYRTWLAIGGATASGASNKPVLDYFGVSFIDYAPGELVYSVLFGDRAQSVLIEYSTDPSMATGVTSIGRDLVLSGNPFIDAILLSSNADRDQTYYLRATPYSGPESGGIVTGTPGDPITQSVYVPRAFVNSATVSFDLSTAGEVKATAGAAGSGYAWVTNNPDTPPGSPTSFGGTVYDIEFVRDNAIPGSGTTLGAPATTPSMVDRALRVVSGTSAAADFKGMEWACPTTSFTMTVKMRRKLVENTFGGAGVGLRRNTSGAGNFVCAYTACSTPFSATNFEIDKYTALTTRSSSGSPSNYGGLLFMPVYFRWIYNGTNITALLSMTGHEDSYRQLFTETAATFLGGAPGRFMLGIDNFGTSANTVYYEWVRFT